MTSALMTLLTSLLLATLAQTVWAADVTLQDDNGTKYVNMPATGTDILTLTDASITTFKVYDDGGKDGNYSANGRQHLTGHPPLECLCLSQLGGEDQGVHTALIDNDDF